jgi:MYXO-CTERM domain-containing protein
MVACLLLPACAVVSRAASAGEPAAAPAAPAVLPASLPLRRDAAAGSDAPGWVPSAALLALTGIVGVWLVRRRSVAKATGLPGSPRAVPLIRIASLGLTPQASVHVVRWNGEELVLGCTAQQVTLLSRRTPPAQEPEP